MLWRGLPVEYSFSIKGSFYLKMWWFLNFIYLFIYFFQKVGGGCGYENPKPFCGKRYMDTNCCQMPTNKYNQIDKWNLEKVSSSNECWRRLIWFATNNQTYLRKLLTIPPIRPSPLVHADKIANSVCWFFFFSPRLASSRVRGNFHARSRISLARTLNMIPWESKGLFTIHSLLKYKNKQNSF